MTLKRTPAFLAGQTAFKNGLNPRDNPNDGLPSATPESKLAFYEWRLGWHYAEAAAAVLKLCDRKRK